MTEDNKYTCSECGRSYNYNKNLRKHVSRAHPGKLSEIAPQLNMQKVYKYLCSLCGKQYNQERNLLWHERNVHKLENSCIKMKCPLCDISVLSKKCYYDHLSTKHDVSIATTDTEFASFEEFNDWKQHIERETLSFYAKKCGSYCASDNITRHLYVCHRSGHHISKSKGVRYKSTNKIGGVCPSSIEVTETGDGRCQVRYVSTHVGHQNVNSDLGLTGAEINMLDVDIVNRSSQPCSSVNVDIFRAANDIDDEDTLDMYEDGESVSEKEIILVQVGGHNIKTTDVNRQKEKMKLNFADLIDTISSPRQLKVSNGKMSTSEAVLAAVGSYIDHQNIGPCVTASGKEQNVQLKERQFCTKKRKLLQQKHFNNPSTAEAQTIIFSVLPDNQ